MPQASFGDFSASELYCDRCRRPRPVRRRLLLALPTGDKYLYVCEACGAEVGEQIDTGGDSPSGGGPGRPGGGGSIVP